jgi:hypothetical protein
MKKFKISPIIISLVLIFVLLGVGCSNSTLPDGSQSYDETFDIVVVGAGMAGPMAAFGAYETNHNLKILLVEATNLFGGGAAKASGGFSSQLLNNRLNPTLGQGYYKAYMTNTAHSGSITDPTYGTINFNHNVQTNETAREYGGYEIEGFPNYTKWAAIIYEARLMYDYLIKPVVEGGVGISEAVYGGYNLNGGMTNNPDGEGGGMMMKGIRAAIESKSSSIDLRFNCKGEELIMENGIVAGVRVNDNGKSKNIRAKKVILATGGFSGSYEGIKANGASRPEIDDAMKYVKTQANKESDGTGIQMAVDVGGVRLENAVIIGAGIQFTSGLHQAIGRTGGANAAKLANAFYMINFGGPQPQLLSPNFLVVDKNGDRFFSESNLGISMSGTSSPGSNKMISHNKPPYWLIVPADPTGVASANPGDTPANNPAPRPSVLYYTFDITVPVRAL